ncbi:trans-sulfuration enzyme family protein [Aquella oligotrophica]|uniref:Cystathionine gamma-synthase n=1 Tax=Aquella oligotrophica TaxID=2067065 RepID=A0A2I7N723_9NEIS|nr:PLP-dependent transferase [Aquella oligotrophica]AUR52240.1 cystathionine gamma-synthase [Aquella oligotrophica]
MNIETQLIHGGIDGDPHTGAVTVPLYLTSTYKQDGIGNHRGYEYSRTGNPTREAVEVLIAELEGGVAGFGFASGMAATTAVMMLFKAHDKILLSSNVYGGTFRVLDKVFKNFKLKYELVDTSNLELVASKITEDVKAIFIETPTNPLMHITDIDGISKLAKKHGLLTIVDNTFMTPYLQQPIMLGADIVLHSATKYLGGHSDLIAGLAVVNNKELAERLHFIQNATGGVLSPFDSWLLIRGIKTLAVRMDRHIENTGKLIDFLRQNKAITRIYYPGINNHKDNKIHNLQAAKGGAMISFVLDNAYNPDKFLQSLKLITLAESLGGIESLISHPATMTHAAIPPEIRAKLGIVDNLIRLSVGIENINDLISDIKHALSIAKEV